MAPPLRRIHPWAPLLPLLLLLGAPTTAATQAAAPPSWQLAAFDGMEADPLPVWPPTEAAGGDRFTAADLAPARAPIPTLIAPVDAVDASAPPALRMLGPVVRTAGRLATTVQLNAPTVSIAPHHSGYRDVTHGAATVSYATPAYVSMDTPRSAVLMFSSGQARPTGFVQVDATDNSSTPPNRMSIRVRSVQHGTWVTPETFFRAGGGANRLAAQFDASTWPSLAHAFDVVVRSYWPDNTMREAPARRVRILIVNERSSRYGLGWSLPGVQQLYDQGDGVYITQGDGTALWFPGTRAQGYTRPEGDVSTVTFNGVGWNRSFRDGTVMVFGHSGYLDVIRDRFGNETRLEYDTSLWPHRISRITDPVGRHITFGYHHAHAIAWIRDPGGRQVDATASGNHVYRFRDPDQVLSIDMHFTGDRLDGYWPRGVSRNFGDPVRWHFDYDAHGNLAAATAPLISTTDAGDTRPRTRFRSLQAAVLPAPGTGTIGNPAARVVPSAVRTLVVSPLGDTTRVQVDRFGLALRVEQPLGRTSRILRDSRGRDTLSIAPSGHRVRKVYSGFDLTRIQDLNTGRRVDYQYGPYGQIRRVSGDTPEVEFFLNAMGLPDSTRVGGPGKRATRFQYQPLVPGRLVRTTDAEGHYRTFGYAANGNMSGGSVGKDGVGTVMSTSHTFDSHGRRISTRVDGVTRETVWYNSMNQPDSVRNAINGTMRYAYSPAGPVTRVTDPKGQVYEFGVNRLGWVVWERDPRSATSSYGYDRAGRATRTTNRRGQAVTTAYDALDRIVAVTADGATTHWTYGTGQQLDRWVQVRNGVSTDRIDVDSAGRPTRVRTTRGSDTYTQTPNHANREGLRTRLTVSGPGVGPWSTNWAYDGERRLERITDRAGRVTTLSYDDDGLPARTNLPNGHWLRTRYSPGHRPSLKAHLGDRDSLSVHYAETGPWVPERSRYLQQGIVSVKQVRRYTFDGAGRLTAFQDRRDTEDCSGFVTPCDTWSTPEGGGSFAYDAVGNPTTGVQNGNRLVTAAGFTMEYDADGNLTRKHRSGYDLRLQWNSLGQMTRSTLNGAVVHYRYDGLGRWAQYDWGAGSIDYIHDGDHLLLERNSAGEVTEYTYYPGTDRPHSIRRGGTVHYYVTDFPGDVVALLAENGTVANRYHYGPFGARAAHTREGTPNALQFHARHFDPATGLYNFRARWYDRDVGRFVSEDPIGLGGGINPYVFAGNNPVNLRDPSGLAAECPREVRTCIPDVWAIVNHYDRTREFCWFMGICEGIALYNERHGLQRPGPGPSVGPGSGAPRAAPAEAPGAAPNAISQCVFQTLVATGGTASSLKAFENIRGSGSSLEWRGANNKWHSARWGGNQYTGGRNAVVAAGSQARLVGRVIGGAGIAVSGGQALVSFAAGDYWGAGAHGMDAAFAVAGTFGGPIGLGASLGYLVVATYLGC